VDGLAFRDSQDRQGRRVSRIARMLMRELVGKRDRRGRSGMADLVSDRPARCYSLASP
jgi:hypothetical protein